MTSEFDWTTDDSVVAQHQPAIAVYTNPRGQAVIRQEAPWPDDTDHVVLVNRENIVSVIYALIDTTDRSLQLTEMCEGGWCDVPRPPRPADIADKPEPEGEPEVLALPAPDHSRERVTADLFSEAPNGRA